MIYVNDEQQQSQYVKMLKDNDLEAVVLNTSLDNHFISLIESKNDKVKFARVDSDLSSILKDEAAVDVKEDNEAIEKVFKDALKDDKLKIEVQPLKDNSVSAIISESEETRRLQEMSRMYGGDPSMFPKEETLIINTSSPLIKKLSDLAKKEDKAELSEEVCRHVYDLAMISHGQLTAEEMNGFIERSSSLLEKLMDK